MVTNETSSEHPVFKELITILRLIDIQPNPEAWEFKNCPALATRSKRKCTKSSEHISNAKELYNLFRIMEEWTETDEFFDQLRQFLNASHCSWHGPKAIESFEAWKKIRVTTIPSSSNQPPTDDESDCDGTLTSLSALATTQLMEPILGEAKRLESTSETDHKPHIHVKTIADGISTMTITATSQKKVIDNNGNANATAAEQIFGLGIVSLQRKGSLRNHSPVFSEIHKPLTSTQKEYGIVYVLGHTIAKGLFKIGWTRVTAEERLNHAGNCYGSNAEILHETHTGAFLAASKAEKLAQTVLRHHNLTVTECEQCGGGHREWFRAPKEMVIETVEIMETFVRLPAYESKDGQTWKLSDAAYDAVKAMCQFSTVRLKSAMAPTEAPIERHSIQETLEEIPTTPRSEGATETTAAVVTPISQDFDQGVDGKSPSIAPEAVESGKGTRRSIGTDSAKRTKRVMKQASKIINRVGQSWNRSREGTSALDGDNNTENVGLGNGNGSGAVDVKDAVMGVLWSLFPEDVKTLTVDVDKKEGGRSVVWAKMVKHEFRAIITDFKVEWKRESEESRDRPSSKSK